MSDPKRFSASVAAALLVIAIATGIRGRSIEQVVDELREYLPGWKQYFILAETPKILGELDQWLRHRLRALHLKRGPVVFREMRARGASVSTAAQCAANTRRWWRSAALYLHVMLTTHYFDELGSHDSGLPPQPHESFSADPPCRVVWQGSPG